MKYSRQREAIRNFLKTRCDHPTAETIYAHVREDHPKISLGTVYRNLGQLSERGEVLKIICGDGADRYDARTDPHYHFVCSSCGAVRDVSVEDVSAPAFLPGCEPEDEIDRCSILFYGTCSACRKKAPASAE